MAQNLFALLNNWDLDRNTKTDLLNLSWSSCLVTTKVTRSDIRKQVLLGAIKGQWSLHSFARHYGWFAQRIAKLRNLQLPSDIETRVCRQVTDLFNIKEKPVIRLQVMCDGYMVPIHVDKNRNTSLVIPVDHTSRCYTEFFTSHSTFDQLVDPSICEKVAGVSIVKPTLIDTTVPHGVSSPTKIFEYEPRISLTAKWQTCRFAELEQWLP